MLIYSSRPEVMQAQSDKNGLPAVPALWWDNDEQVSLRVEDDLILYDYPKSPHLTQTKKKTKHKCKDCGKGFSKPVHLQNHRCVQDRKKFECNECGKQYIQKGSLKNHMHMHSIGKIKKCKSKVSEDPPVDKSSMNSFPIFYRAKRLECGECGALFAEKRQLNRHMKIHLEQYKCGECGKIFEQKKKLQSHVKYSCAVSLSKSQLPTVDRRVKKAKNANSADGNSSSVKTANEKVANKGDCLQWKEVKYEKIESDGCSGEMNMDSEEIKVENEEMTIDKYSGEIKMENFEEEYCSDMASLERVSETLTNKCLECGQQFAEASSLKLHLRAHFQARSLQCNLCGKMLGNKRDLKMHALVHTGERNFKCEVCGKCFKQKSNLSTHRLLHTEEKKFRCDVCGKGFTQKGAWKTHMASSRVHRNLGFLTCGICGQGFSENTTLQNHLAEHNEEVQHQCEECGKLFSQKCELKMHMFIHTGERNYKCENCSELFLKKGDLMLHIQEWHSDKKSNANSLVPVESTSKAEESSYINRPVKSEVQETPMVVSIGEMTGENQDTQMLMTTGSNLMNQETQLPAKSVKLKSMCLECGKCCANKHTLKIHMIVHKPSQEYKCGKCNRVFTRKESLGVHMRLHTGKNKFTCGECGRDFVRSDSFRYHMFTHSREKNFKCEKCTSSFVRKVDWRNHMKLAHGMRPEEEFQCKECGKSYTHQQCLSLHMRIHTGEKNYECKECGKLFYRRDYLMTHILSHTQEKKRVCKVCGKRFLTKSHINRHMQNVHGEKK